MNRFAHRQQIQDPEVNLTPLIDVVFVILIMFIVVAPLLELDRVELADGASSDKAISVQDNSPLAIHVFQDNTIRFNNKLVNIFELEDLLKQAKASHPSVNPQLFHDRRALFGTYQSVKNALEVAGYTQVDVVLKPS